MSDNRLSLVEVMTLAGDMAHSPDCHYSGHSLEGEVFYQDEEGLTWEDEFHTIPFVPQACTCGYFKNLRSGQDKLRASYESVLYTE